MNYCQSFIRYLKKLPFLRTARAKKSRPPRGKQAKVREIKINDFHENQPKTPINRAQIIDETVEDDFIVIVSNGEKKCTPKFFPGTVVKKYLPKNEDSLYLIKVKRMNSQQD